MTCDAVGPVPKFLVQHEGKVNFEICDEDLMSLPGAGNEPLASTEAGCTLPHGALSPGYRWPMWKAKRPSRPDRRRQTDLFVGPSQPLLCRESRSVPICLREQVLAEIPMRLVTEGTDKQPDKTSRFGGSTR